MADADLNLARAGGRVNADTGMLLLNSDVDRIGGMAMQSLLAVLALACFDDTAGVPLTGFPRDQAGTDHCKVTSTGALTYSVSTGWGLSYNSAATVDEFGPDKYLPIVLDTAATGALDAHEANPRIDLVCIAPAWVSDQSGSRLTKDPVTKVVTSASVNQRMRFGAVVQVVKGTASASPVAPAVPSGYVEIGRAAVPATTGSAVWEDTRPVLQLGHYLAALPRHAHAPYVPLGSAGELLVSASSPASLVLQVAGGRAVINGITRYYKAGTVTVGAAHATLPRIDLVVANENGTLSVTAGTAASTPVAPATPANSVALAQVSVVALDTTLAGSDLTDVRPRGPIATGQLQDNAVTQAKVADGAIGNAEVIAGSLNPNRMAVEIVQIMSALAPSIVGNVATISCNAPWLETGEATTEAIPMVAEVFVRGSRAGSAAYGIAGAFTIDTWLQDETISSNPDVALQVSTGCTLTAGLAQVGDLQAPRMFFTKTGGGSGEIKLCRRDGAVVGTYLVVVKPLGHLGTPLETIVTFT